MLSVGFLLVVMPLLVAVAGVVLLTRRKWVLGGVLLGLGLLVPLALVAFVAGGTIYYELGH